MAPDYSTGRARSSCVALAPTIKVSVPATAPPTPPETGGINKVNAGGLRSLRHLLAGGGGDGGAVNHQRAFGQGGQQANLPFAAQVQAFNVLASRSMLMTTSAPCTAFWALTAAGRLTATTLAMAAAPRSQTL